MMKAISLRLDEKLLDSVKRIAEARHVSLNSFVIEALKEAERRERSESLRAAFEENAKHVDPIDYSYAQAEVMLAEDF